MAVRSWPPSSAITMRPPARPMSSWVSRPKPANAQSWRSRNTSRHSTIMSKKCRGYPGSPYEMLTFGRDVVSSQGRLVTLHCVETSRHQNHIWTEMLGNGHHHIPVHTPSTVKECSFHKECILHTSSQTITCFILLLYHIFSDTRNAHFWCIPKGSEVLHITHGWLHPSSPCYVYIKTIASTWPHLQRHGMATAYYSLPLFGCCCSTCFVMRARMGI